MHIHVPDGVLPLWLWMLGYSIIIIFLFIAVRKVRGEEKRGIYAAAMAAIMLVAMSIPLGVPYHINLTVLAGIILGPWWALIATFVTNLILATFGHGGITIVGLNTIVTWFESLVGFYMFKVLRKAFMQKNWGLATASGASTFTALMLSTILVIGIVAASGINPAEIIHHENHGGEETQISIAIFAALTIPIAVVGAVIEAVVTSLILVYVKKVKPTLIPG
jgi:cobalt/nickel transport system permease protein